MQPHPLDSLLAQYDRHAVDIYSRYTAQLDLERVNPQGHAMQLVFWEQALVNVSKKCDKVSTANIAELARQLTWRGYSPQESCLTDVILALSSQRKIIASSDWEEFANTGAVQKTKEATGGILSTVYSSARWLVWGDDEPVKKKQPPTLAESYVIVSLVKERSKELWKLLCEKGEPVLLLDEIPGADKVELIKMLQWLQGMQLIELFTTDSAQTAVKILKRFDEGNFALAESVQPKQFPSTITNIDRAFAKIKFTKIALTKRCRELESRKQELLKQALAYRDNQKARAMDCLKKKKSVEKQIEQLQTQLFNLDSLLTEIGNSQNTDEILQTFKAGADALQSLNERVQALDPDKVMSDIQEGFQDADAVATSLANLSLDGDEDALNQELDALVQEVALQDKPSPTTRSARAAAAASSSAVPEGMTDAQLDDELHALALAAMAPTVPSNELSTQATAKKEEQPLTA